MPWSRIFNFANISFDAIRENKILKKIFGFTVVFYSTALSESKFFAVVFVLFLWYFL